MNLELRFYLKKANPDMTDQEINKILFFIEKQWSSETDKFKCLAPEEQDMILTLWGAINDIQ